MRPGCDADRAQPDQHAGRERRPVERVVPDGEGLPHPAEDAPPGGRPARGPAARAPGSRRRRRRARRRAPVEVASGTGPEPASRRAAAIELRRTPGGAGGRVGLVRVVQLDDLDRLVERRRRGGEAHHQDRRRSRSWGRPGRRSPGASPSQPRRVSSRSSSKPVVPTTAWMPWSMQNSRLSITTSGWVKSTTASAPGGHQVVELVVDVDLRHQLECRRRPRPPGTPRRRPCPARPARPP